MAGDGLIVGSRGGGQAGGDLLGDHENSRLLVKFAMISRDLKNFDVAGYMVLPIRARIVRDGLPPLSITSQDDLDRSPVGPGLEFRMHRLREPDKGVRDKDRFVVGEKFRETPGQFGAKAVGQVFDFSGKIQPRKVAEMKRIALELEGGGFR